jgi:hypothetical protein
MSALPTDRQGRHNPHINAQAAGRQEEEVKVRHYLDEIDRWKQVITGFDARIARLLTDRRQDLANLTSGTRTPASASSSDAWPHDAAANGTWSP